MKYEFNDEAVLLLMEEVISQARADFETAYLLLYKGSKGGLTEYEMSQVILMYQSAKKFFYGPLFQAICPMDSDEYIKLMIREVRKKHDIRDEQTARGV